MLYSLNIQPIDPSDEIFWDQFWADNVDSPQDVFTLIPASEIRQLRDESPNNLATLCYKAVEKLVKAVDTSCRTQQDQQTGNFFKKSILKSVPLRASELLRNITHSLITYSYSQRIIVNALVFFWHSHAP